MARQGLGLARIKSSAEAVETFRVLNDTFPKATGTEERLHRGNTVPNL
jgi:hypothetical protein